MSLLQKQITLKRDKGEADRFRPFRQESKLFLYPERCGRVDRHGEAAGRTDGVRNRRPGSDHDRRVYGTDKLHFHGYRPTGVIPMSSLF